MIFILNLPYSKVIPTYPPHNNCKYTSFPIDKQQYPLFFHQKNKPFINTHHKMGFVGKSEEQFTQNSKTHDITQIRRNKICTVNLFHLSSYYPHSQIHHHREPFCRTAVDSYVSTVYEIFM